MDMNYNLDNMEILYIDNKNKVEEYVLLNDNMYKSIIQNININYLLILFALSCLTTLYCFPKKDRVKNKYILLSTKEMQTDSTETTEGKIIDKV